MNVTLNAGAYGEKSGDEIERYVTYGLGASVALTAGIRIGAEAVGERKLGAEVEKENFAGPSLSFGRDRLWVSSSLQFGLGQDNPMRRGRVVIGTSL